MSDIQNPMKYPIKLDAAVQWRSHPSAKIAYADFLKQDMLYMIAKGFWTVVPYETVQHPPTLWKLSPAGVVPQRTRQPRVIIDYTFSKANPSTTQIADQHAM